MNRKVNIVVYLVLCLVLCCGLAACGGSGGSGGSSGGGSSATPASSSGGGSGGTPAGSGESGSSTGGAPASSGNAADDASGSAPTSDSDSDSASGDPVEFPGDSAAEPAAAAPAADTGQTSGDAFSAPGDLDIPAAPSAGEGEAVIDTGHVNQGYVGAACVNGARLKFQVKCGEASYNYDLPNDGTGIIVPVNMGNGSYNFRIMANTEGSNYAEVTSQQADVALDSEFAPFLRPNMFVNYNGSSACVSTARDVASGAANAGDALAAVCTYVMSHVTYDTAKAQQLANQTGYVPNPDSTLSSGTGICFDYASLGAAMLRSLGIPTKVLTGTVSPDEVYHAWIMVYINGTWKSAQFSVDQQTWSRVDLTFGATGADGFVGDGKSYADRYVY